VYALLAKLLKVFYVNARIQGIQRALRDTNAVLVANHLGSFGPIALMSSLIHRLYPWVVHEVTSLQECAAYIQRDFVEKELKLRSFAGREVSRLIGRVCVHLMAYLQAIPVYGKSREIARTFAISLACLESRKPLLIFPENDESKQQPGLCRLNTGFIRLARWLYDSSRRVLTFYPVAVNRKVRAIRVGEPVRFNPDTPYREERRRIQEHLERSIAGMYRQLEEEQAARRRRPSRRPGGARRSRGRAA